jgi:Tfp pilus assembly protein PilZ
MRLVPCVFSTGEAFLRCYSDDYPHGAVFCETRARLSLDEPVLVEVTFPELPNRAVLRGRVVSAVEKTGAWVQLSPRDHSVTCFVVEAARGCLDNAVAGQMVRHHPRYPARVSVRYRIDELDEASAHQGAETAEIADLGIGGAFVRSENPPRVGTRINLQLTTGYNSGNLEIDGRVAWTRAGVGFGVRFDQRGPGSARPLRPLIRRISETGEMPLWALRSHRTRGDATPAPR